MNECIRTHRRHQKATGWCRKGKNVPVFHWVWRRLDCLTAGDLGLLTSPRPAGFRRCFSMCSCSAAVVPAEEWGGVWWRVTGRKWGGVAKKRGEQVNEGRKKHVQVKITKNNTSESNLTLRNFCGCNCRIYIILHTSNVRRHLSRLENGRTSTFLPNLCSNHR